MQEHTSPTTPVSILVAVTKLVHEGETTWSAEVVEGLEYPLYAVAGTVEDLKTQIVGNLQQRGLTGTMRFFYPQRVSADPATEKQVNYAMHLYRRKVNPNLTDLSLEKVREWMVSLSKKEIGKFITEKATMPDLEKATPNQKVKVEEGIYKVRESIYKVLRAVHGSGHLYVKKLELVGGKGSFKKAPAGSMTLVSREGTKLTTEQAKEFGDLYGVCCCCGRALTDEESIRLGVGPICRKKYLA